MKSWYITDEIRKRSGAFIVTLARLAFLLAPQKMIQWMIKYIKEISHKIVFIISCLYIGFSFFPR